MSFSEFTDGYMATLRWSASSAALQSIKRAVSREELYAVFDSVLGELTTFWSKYGTAIEAARGIVGCSRSVSWQAGHDLCFVRNGRRAFRATEWGADLSSQLTTDSRSLGATRVEVSSGVISIVGESRTRIG